MGAGTRDDASMGFDVADLSLTTGPPAAPRRPSLQVEVFNHVLTDNSQTSFEAELQLPPPSWAFGRVLLTLDIHDAGSDWDEWDRTGEIFIQDADGAWRGLVPFITSYRTECHWVVDVTHFRPLLSGTTRLKIAAGTSFYKDRGFMLSVSLAFHHALPDDLRSPAPARVTPLWHGTAHYRSAQNHFSDFFTPQAVTLGEQTEAARVFLTTTGHSQVGEFTPSLRTLVFAPVQGGEAEQRYENTLWKTDCYLNPNRPQFGTWKYPRAGWAPGDVVAPWWIDLTPHITPGAVAELRYEPSPYDFEGADEVPDAGAINAANQFVRAWLIEYATPTDAVAAPTLLVTNVVADSAAARAGLRAGDFLASYDGARVDSVAELGAAKTAASEAGKARVPVVVFRGEQRLELELDSGRMGVNLSGG
ncbi:MAG: hypothetical protein DRQ55_15320 [Planctomycetota bacterium]|nr:MAG: hypothetical protein DRQ55_15320 [Planctomycetota bacterium]